MGCFAIAVGLALVGATQALAGTPDRGFSTCPTTVLIATDGSTCCFDVIVRDGGANPVPSSTVHVDFGTCAVTFCPAQPPGVTVVGNGVNAVTNAAGQVHICVCAAFTGSCSATIIADNVFLCTVPMDRCGPTPNRMTSWGQLKIIYR
jgi:hypothetical protein